MDVYVERDLPRWQITGFQGKVGRLPITVAVGYLFARKSLLKWAR
jgi:hypothetical protein